MRNEEEVQEMADKAATVRRVDPTDYLRGVEAALDWVLDEDMEDDPV